VIYIQETHHVIGGMMPEFLDSLKNEWKPLVEKDGSSRLLWAWLHVVGTGPSYRAITLLQVEDYRAWGALVERYQKKGSDLNHWYENAWKCRRKVVGKVMTPTEWSPIPKAPAANAKADHPSTHYLHDVAFPHPGSVEKYIETLGRVYYPHMAPAKHAGRVPVPSTGTAPMLSMELCLRVAPGAGEVHEVALVQRINDWPAFCELLKRGGVPSPEKPKVGSNNWMEVGLTLRDQWESQIFGTTLWSPLD